MFIFETKQETPIFRYNTSMKNSQNETEKQISQAIIHLFWQANLKQKWSLFLTYGMRIPAYAIQNTVIPLFIAYGLQAIINRQFEQVPQYALVVLLLTVTYGILSAIGVWAISQNATEGLSYLQKEIFANYLNKDYEFYGNSFYGALSSQATRLRDVASDYNKLVTLDIPQQIVTVLTGLIVIGYNAPLLAIVTLICMLFVLSYTIWSSRWRLKFRRQLSETSSELAGVIGDALTHSTTVKSFAAEEYEKNLLEPRLELWKQAQSKSWRASIPADFGRNFLAAVTISILLILTAYLYQKANITIAIVALIQFYVIKMITVTQDIAETIKNYEMIMGASYQSVKTMLIEPTIKDNPHPKKLPKDLPKQTINFNDVNYWYHETNKNPAVKNFSLTIKRGEKIGLAGYSGSGKTTITKLLLRFMDVSNGSIKLDDINLKDLRQTDLRKIISYVPQEPLLFHRTIAENIAYGNPTANNKSIEKAAKMAHVDEFVQELPNKYNTLVGERGVKLSGGQRQRVAIARAILKDAPILVLDEATSALDSKSEHLIQQALANLMKNRTTLVIAHRLSTIQRMDRIIVMNKGQIIQTGTHTQLLKEPNGIYAKLWAHQSGGYLIEDEQIT